MIARVNDTPEDKARPTTSRGEQWFDWLVYGGISFAGVFLSTIPFTYWIRYGSANKIWAKTDNAFKGMGLSATASEQLCNTIYLGFMGHASVLPIKYFEDNKPYYVNKLNHLLGDKTDPGALSVDDEPKQSWGSILLGRVAAVSSCWLGFKGASLTIGDARLQKFERDFAEHIVCRPLGLATHTDMLNKTVANETKTFRLGKIAALDVFATAAATLILYFGSRFFAKRNKERWDTDGSEAGKQDETALRDDAGSFPQAGLSAPSPGEKRFCDDFVKRAVALGPRPRPLTYRELLNEPQPHLSLSV